jgi:pyruvate dehydrogenase E2 component (dihydrolipoamide acetyltransferase)
MGTVRPRPAVIEGQVTVRDTAWFTLTFDHRFIDGATAAAFLQDLNEVIQRRESLLEETNNLPE